MADNTYCMMWAESFSENFLVDFIRSKSSPPGRYLLVKENIILGDEVIKFFILIEFVQLYDIGVIDFLQDIEFGEKFLILLFE